LTRESAAVLFSTMPDRHSLLTASDADLLAQCRCERFRGSGPGGQHRNTTDSAVRLTLLADEAISVTCEDARSQHRNRALALRKLRLAIALQLREPAAGAWTGQWDMARHNPDYPQLVAAVLDALCSHDFQVSTAAASLAVSTNQLVKRLAADPTVWTQVNRKRQARGLRPLRERR
jgi:hypothetical protein